MFLKLPERECVLCMRHAKQWVPNKCSLGPLKPFFRGKTFATEFCSWCPPESVWPASACGCSDLGPRVSDLHPQGVLFAGNPRVLCCRENPLWTATLGAWDMLQSMLLFPKRIQSLWPHVLLRVWVNCLPVFFQEKNLPCQFVLSKSFDVNSYLADADCSD